MSETEEKFTPFVHHCVVITPQNRFGLFFISPTRVIVAVDEEFDGDGSKPCVWSREASVDEKAECFALLIEAMSGHVIDASVKSLEEASASANEAVMET